MSKTDNLTDFLTDIANAIREKKGTTEKINPQDFSTEIANLSSGGSANVVIVSFYNYDGTLLYQKPTIKGDDCVDVVAKGLLTKPTKASDNYYNYAFSGWSKTNDDSVDSGVLNAISEDVNVYACYTSSTRYYTINFYDETKLVQTLSCAYGTTPNPNEPMKESYNFLDWNPAITTVTGDMNYYAQFEYDDGYIKDDWDVIATNVANGTYKDVYSIGRKKQVSINDVNNITRNIDFEIIAFDHDILSSGGKAGITFLATQSIEINGRLINNNNKDYSWCYTTIRNNLQGDAVFNKLPTKLKNAIKKVKKSCGGGNVWEIMDDTLWLPSAEELFLTEHKSSTAVYDSRMLNDNDTPYEKFNVSDGTDKIRTSVATGVAIDYATRTKCLGYTYGIHGVSTTGYWKLLQVNNDSTTNCVIGFCI